MEVGDAEAAFVEIFLLAALLKDFGVDEHVALVFGAVGVGLLVVGAEADDHQLDGAVDLGCCQTDAVGGIHGFEHIGNELFQFGVVFGDGL